MWACSSSKLSCKCLPTVPVAMLVLSRGSLVVQRWKAAQARHRVCCQIAWLILDRIVRFHATILFLCRRSMMEFKLRPNRLAANSSAPFRRIAPVDQFAGLSSRTRSKSVIVRSSLRRKNHHGAGIWRRSCNGISSLMRADASSKARFC